jgi:hypothetical protein
MIFLLPENYLFSEQKTGMKPPVKNENFLYFLVSVFQVFSTSLGLLFSFIISIPQRLNSKTRKNIKKICYNFFDFISDVSKAVYHFAGSIARLIRNS